MRYALLLSVLLFTQFAQAADDLAFKAAPLKLDYPDHIYAEEIPMIAYSPDKSRLYVFNRGRHSLLAFKNDGHFIREIGHGLFSTPHGLRVDADGNIWTADTGNHAVIKFSPEGRVVMVLGKKGTASKGWFDRDYNQLFLNKPSDIAFDADGNIYVADGGNFRIVKYSAEGAVLGHFGEKGDGPGQFNFPHSVLVDEKGRLLVADRENKRIQIFDLDGKFQEQWDDIGYPYVLAAGEKGIIWMSDARIDKLVKLSLDGDVLGRFGGPGKTTGRYGFLHGVEPFEGGLLVSDILNWKVEVLRPAQ